MLGGFVRDERITIRPDDRGYTGLTISPPLIADQAVIDDLVGRVDRIADRGRRLAGSERVTGVHAEGVLAGWHARAASDPARIVLADLGDARADMAATRLGAEGLAIVIPPVLDRSIAAVVAGAAHAAARGAGPR